MPGLFRRAAFSRLLCLAISVSGTALLCSSPTHAALTINGTRIIYESHKRSVSVIISNPSKRPFAVQTWINTERDDTTTAVPFMPTPALFRLNAGKEQYVQINQWPHTLPEDRESVFYFNVQEIPQSKSSDTGVLNIAMRTRIKLFYRPTSIKNPADTHLKQLQWAVKKMDGHYYLEAHNPSPYFISFASLELRFSGQKESPTNPAMAAPFSRQLYRLSAFKPTADALVTFSSINDYGGVSPPLTAAITSAD